MCSKRCTYIMCVGRRYEKKKSFNDLTTVSKYMYLWIKRNILVIEKLYLNIYNQNFFKNDIK